MIDLSWLWPWLPRVLPKALDWLFPKRSRAGHLIFVEQPMCWWTYLEGERAIQLHLMLHGTNNSDTDTLIVSRVQVRRTGWKFLLSKWQDCNMTVEIGGKLRPCYS